MKKSIIFILALAITTGVCAQKKKPKASPLQKVTQTVGITDISVEYSRPSVKGREIFGGLVPFDEIWRTGANNNTIISFDNTITINGKDIKAGSYAIFVKPSKKNWVVYIYSDTDNWGSPKKWDDSKVVAKAKLSTKSLPANQELFAISFDSVSHESTTIKLSWAKTYVELPIKVKKNF